MAHYRMTRLTTAEAGDPLSIEEEEARLSKMARGCDAHLSDLEAAYPSGIPNECRILSRGRPVSIAPAYLGGGATSPAAAVAGV